MLNADRNLGFDDQTVELDLGDLASAPQIRLVIDGRTHYPTSPEGVARSRSFGVRTRLEVVDATGAWVEVPRDRLELPRPPEFHRPYVLDLTGIFPAPDYRVRLTFLFKTFIDTLAVDVTPDLPLVVQTAPLLEAELRYYGTSRRTDGELYEHVYGEFEERGARPFPGAYTRYGEVGPLLAARDDLFVIYFGADEIALRFAPPPPPAPGGAWTFVMVSVGYYTDNMVDVAHTVAPLPFAAMSNFPYDEAVERYPDDAVHRDYLSTWNTRIESP